MNSKFSSSFRASFTVLWSSEGTYRTVRMWRRITCHHLQHLIPNTISCTDSRRCLLLISLLLGFLFFSFHSTLIFGHNTFGSHPNSKAFFQSTLLTFSSHVHVHFAGMSKLTTVDSIFCNAPPKKSFTAFTGKCIVMIAGCPITTHQTQFFLQTWCRSLFRFFRIGTIICGITIQTAGR